MNFKIGDRVTAKGNILGFEGPGTITQIDAGHSICEYMVRFDRKGFPPVWAYNDTVKPLVESKIVITSNGPVTLARLYEGKKVVKRAEAKCAPSDTYDFGKGADIAFERLMGGRYVQPVAPKTEDKPEPTAEPIKLYCVKEMSDWLTVGKIYESVDGWITTDDSVRHIDSVMRERGHLVPLKSRPAKVGEWVYICNGHPTPSYGGYKNGEIYPVGYVDEMNARIDGANLFRSGRLDGITYVAHDEYLVLDGFKGEPEQPQYYSGKVVCVKSGDADFAVGKVYEFKDGVILDNDGDKRPASGNQKIKSLGDPYMETWQYKFIEFKGEAGA